MCTGRVAQSRKDESLQREVKGEGKGHLDAEVAEIVADVPTASIVRHSDESECSINWHLRDVL
jgi:hypothetical protein